MKKIAMIVIGLACAGVSLAADYTLGNLRIEHPWSRAMPVSSTTGGVYFILSNQGKTADKLIAASTQRAKTVELHTHIHEGGVMKMRQVPGVDVAAGAQVKFVPGSYHVMLMGLTQPLKTGDRFPLTLKFEKAGETTVEVQVEDGKVETTHH